jgi:hypothetical protein
MSLEAKFRKALEIIGVTPCACDGAGTCASCVAIKALISDGFSVADDQTVTISIDGQEGEPTTRLILSRTDKQFPLITDDPSQATSETILRILGFLIEAVKGSAGFDAAIAKTGFHIDVRRE